jgi:Exopolysaccharide synthesis, ExoD
MLPARRGRARARYLNRGRPAAHDPRVPDDRGPPAPVFPGPCRNLEKIVHPRWPTPLEATKRLVGTFVVDTEHHRGVHSNPLGAVVPALVIALISLAYLEEDGLLLSIALLAPSSC